MKIRTKTTRISKLNDNRLYVCPILPFYNLSKWFGLSMYAAEQSSKQETPFTNWRRKTIDILAVAIHVTAKSALIYVSINADSCLASTGVYLSDKGNQVIQLYTDIGTIVVMLYWIMMRTQMGELVREFNSVDKMVGMHGIAATKDKKVGH